MSLLKKITVGAMALALLFPAVAGAVTINEVRIDNGGADTDEYFELMGAPGLSLDGYTYIVIGDGAGGSGTVENVTDLTGQSIQADGFLSVHKEGTVGACTYDVDLTMNFENSDNVTHMLVIGFTGALDDDLDTDDDGILDITPWTSMEDCLALIESVGSGDLVYCDLNQVGPDGTFVPAHALKCGDMWAIGQFGDSPFTCAASLDTPGEDNSPGCSVPTEETSWGSMKSRY